METLVLISLFTLSFFSISYSEYPTTDRPQLPMIAFSWWDDKGTFKAGDTATIKLKVLENGNKIDKSAFHSILNVNGKEGNSSYVSTGLSNFEGDFSNWKISFTPIRVGLFNVLINEDRYKVYDSSLHFHVEPGNMYPSVCVASWKGMKYEFEAGSKAAIMVLLKDACGNIISKYTEINREIIYCSVVHRGASLFICTLTPSLSL